jgi:ribonuclease HI
MFPKITQNTKFTKIYPELTSELVFKLQFDGCSKGNPGLAGAGSVLYYQNKEIWSTHFFVGEKATNNQAEYTGLIIGLKKAIELDIKSLHVEGDSLLVINQLKEIYKCNSPNLFDLYNEANLLIQKFDNIYLNHIFRNKNKRADELSNIAVNEYLKNLTIIKS